MKDYKVPLLGNPNPNSELRLRPALRYAVRYRGQLFPVHGNQVTLGRNLDCDIVLSGPLVSRVHARLVIDAEGATVEDLLSRNGVAVDGVLIDRPQRVEPGARIRLGDETIELIAERLDRPSWTTAAYEPISERPSANLRTTESDRPSGQNRLVDSQRQTTLEENDELTNRADLFDLLGASVERAFAANNGEEVIRLIGRHLERIVEQARTERQPNDDVYGRAALYGIRIAVATGKPVWFDYVIRLYTTLSVPLPLPIVDQLSAQIRRVPGVNKQLLRDYVGRLRLTAGRMTAEQRFRLQRVESLERLVSL
ncbi:MAG TPA: FHA domain-containing protein [Polyangiaceae bacterium]|nr:FHA domain-containing protein [Polyangiaceae bacterium]